MVDAPGAPVHSVKLDVVAPVMMQSDEITNCLVAEMLDEHGGDVLIEDGVGSAATPTTTVPPTGATRIAAGYAHTCAVLADPRAGRSEHQLGGAR